MFTHCPKCKSTELKNGHARGKQRHKCKACSYQFTRLDGRPRKPEATRHLAMLLYQSGISMNRSVVCLPIYVDVGFREVAGEFFEPMRRFLLPLLHSAHRG